MTIFKVFEKKYDIIFYLCMKVVAILNKNDSDATILNVGCDFLFAFDTEPFTF